jgi:hypothetical protein
MNKILESEATVLGDESIDKKKTLIDDALLKNISGGREECSNKCAWGCQRERCVSGPVLLPT